VGGSRVKQIFAFCTFLGTSRIPKPSAFRLARWGAPVETERGNRKQGVHRFKTRQTENGRSLNQTQSPKISPKSIKTHSFDAIFDDFSTSFLMQLSSFRLARVNYPVQAERDYRYHGAHRFKTRQTENGRSLNQTQGREIVKNDIESMSFD
jgi:hypothetical protein